MLQRLQLLNYCDFLSLVLAVHIPQGFHKMEPCNVGLDPNRPGDICYPSAERNATLEHFQENIHNFPILSFCSLRYLYGALRISTVL